MGLGVNTAKAARVAIISPLWPKSGSYGGFYAQDEETPADEEKRAERALKCEIEGV